MVRRIVLATALVSGLALSWNRPARADEEVIPLDQVPKVILDAVKAKFPEAKLDGATKEVGDDKKLVYEIERDDIMLHAELLRVPCGHWDFLVIVLRSVIKAHAADDLVLSCGPVQRRDGIHAAGEQDEGFHDRLSGCIHRRCHTRLHRDPSSQESVLRM